MEWRKILLYMVAALYSLQVGAATTKPLKIEGSNWRVIIDSHDGSILRYEYKTNNDSRSVPFRTDLHRGLAFEGVEMRPDSTETNSFCGVKDSLLFRIRYRSAGDHLSAECSIKNIAHQSGDSNSIRLKLGVDSEMRSYPEWNYKFFPTLVRCEPDFAWGYFQSPMGDIIAFATEEPIESHALNYIYEGIKEWRWGHITYGASLDLFTNYAQPPRHPQDIRFPSHGESLKWQIHMGIAPSLDRVKPLLSQWADIPLIEAERYTLSHGEQADIELFSQHNVSLKITSPSGKEISYKELNKGNRQIVRTDTLNEYGTYHIVATANGKQSEAMLYVRKKWSWYLDMARDFVSKYPPYFSASCETYYGYYAAFLAALHNPKPQVDRELEERFTRNLSQLINPQNGLPQPDSDPRRIQNFSSLAGMLVDLWQSTKKSEYLHTASLIGDYICSPIIRCEDGALRRDGIHYTAVIYPAKSLIELADAELSINQSKRALLHYQTANDAVEDLARRLDNIETEGDMTFEDGMITCSALQMALYALRTSNDEQRSRLTRAAQIMISKHQSLEQRLIPDCRMRNATLRYWEALDVYLSPNQAMTSPHGWSAWKIYATCYLYLLTGDRTYLEDMFATLGTCVQLMRLDGHLRWAFIADPYIDALVAHPDINNLPNRVMRNEVVGEEYIDLISTWHRPQEELFTRFGEVGGAGDNTVYEIFKALEECALTTCYVILDGESNYCYNGSIEFDEFGVMHIHPAETCIDNIHINTSSPIEIYCKLDNTEYKERLSSGMHRIGREPYPKITLN